MISYLRTNIVDLPYCPIISYGVGAIREDFLIVSNSYPVELDSQLATIALHPILLESEA